MNKFWILAAAAFLAQGASTARADDVRLSPGAAITIGSTRVICDADGSGTGGMRSCAIKKRESGQAGSHAVMNGSEIDSVAWTLGEAEQTMARRVADGVCTAAACALKIIQGDFVELTMNGFRIWSIGMARDDARKVLAEYRGMGICR